MSMSFAIESERLVPCLGKVLLSQIAPDVKKVKIIQAVTTTGLVLILLSLFVPTAQAQRTYPPPSQCPVVATLASSKVPHLDKTGDHIVIWFWNQGSRTTHGVELHLMMLDAAGNRYPASQKYLVTGDEKPKTGDVVAYSTKDEEEHFGAYWNNIEGVEVYVTSIMFADATTWKPRRGVVCKTAFINSDYDKEMERYDKIFVQRWKAADEEWKREHPDKERPALPTGSKNP